MRANSAFCRWWQVAATVKSGLKPLNAESYAERVNSAAKLIANTGNSNVRDEDIERLTVLRMNRDFIFHAVYAPELFF